MKLRTTVQLSGAITSTVQKKATLKREDSFLKRFSTRQQVPETQVRFRVDPHLRSQFRISQLAIFWILPTHSHNSRASAAGRKLQSPLNRCGMTMFGHFRLGGIPIPVKKVTTCVGIQRFQVDRSGRRTSGLGTQSSSAQNKQNGGESGKGRPWMVERNAAYALMLLMSFDVSLFFSSIFCWHTRQSGKARVGK